MWQADKDDHALPEVLVLAVLERELHDRDGHHADCVLGIGVDLRLEDGSDCFDECAEARGLVIAVSHVLCVTVKHDRGGGSQ